MTCIITRDVNHWAYVGCSGSMCTTACSSSHQYPATSHSHWRGVGQHSSGHNQQPDQHYVKEMCRAIWGKWWSHLILTGFLINFPSFYLRYLWPIDAYLYSQSCEINILQPNEFISIDWFPSTNCNSAKSSTFLLVAFDIFVQCTKVYTRSSIINQILLVTNTWLADVTASVVKCLCF